MQPEAAPIRLVVGLGNPGPDYAGTRHNIGFAVLDELARDAGVAWERGGNKWEALWAKSPRGFLLKPLSYMNHSGEPLVAFAQFYKIDPAEILIVLDDFSLPLGRLRLRRDGSSGGHNGLESIFFHFASDEIPRLRIGIGGPPREGSVDYVLGRFFEEEQPLVTKTVVRAVGAVHCAIDNGVVSAMNTFNQAQE